MDVKQERISRIYVITIYKSVCNSCSITLLWWRPKTGTTVELLREKKISGVRSIHKSTVLFCFNCRYTQEGIDIDHEDDMDETLGSPQALVSLMDKGSSQSATMLRTSQSDLSSSRQMERKGLLWLLDEETVCSGGNDESFLDRLFAHYGDRGNT